MALPKDKAWFRAKRYGYGWGLPMRWQGWVVLLSFIFVLQGAAVAFAAKNLAVFIAIVLAASATLIAICAVKGEKAKWRWGTTDDEAGSK